MMKINFGSGLILVLIFATALFWVACEKQEDIIQKDSEQMMRELEGKWDLVSYREIRLKTTNNGYTWDVVSDTTKPASGAIDFAAIDKRDYTGSLAIRYDTIDESHEIYGHVYKNSVDEKVWINTEDQSNIQAFLIYGTESAENILFFQERGKDYFILWIAEMSGTFTTQREKYFRFERTE